MRCKPQARVGIKQYSCWQYLTIFTVLIFLLISMLPNIYREQIVLQVSNKYEPAQVVSAKKIKKILSKEGFSVNSISSQENSSNIIFDTESDIGIAEKILIGKLGDSYTVKQIIKNKMPLWLKRIGAEPIKLGLDLSGGVLFILSVDVERAFSEKIQLIEQTIKKSMKSSGVYHSKVSINSQNQIVINLQSKNKFKQVVLDMQKQFPTLTVQFLNNKTALIFYSDAEKVKYHQEVMSQVLTTMRGRIDELGITEAVTQRLGKNRIRIELPGVKDPKEAKATIGATATLDFYQLQAKSNKAFKLTNGESVNVAPIPIFSGEHIINAQAGRDEMGIPLVNLVLNDIGGEKMLKFSSENIGKPMASVFSEYYQNAQGQSEKVSRVISIATIQSQLSARFSITNLSSFQEAKKLALLIRAGSLTVPVTIVKQRTINATLGDTNIQSGMLALALGIALTLLFMVIWYRRLGLIANCTLLLNLLCLLGLMSLLPGVVLTLPGIAGFVLTVGMAVDSNVLIFERIKEEKKRGRSLALSVEYGYRNAFATIFDANITTLVTAIILYTIGYGAVKGFAITLGLGILTSMFTGVFISRVLTNLFYIRSVSKSNCSGRS